MSSSSCDIPDVAEAIVQKAERENFDFIAMATHGRGGVQHWALGSITERVLHATKLPLLIMRPPDNQPRPPSKSTEGTESKTGDEIVVAETTGVQIESWSGLL